MYRIAETLRVLLFMTLAIVIFNFYPLTAIMIVMLALLNDGAILSIAYDNVIYRNQPEAWNMRLILGIATVLGLVGPIAAFGLFFLGDRVFHLGHSQLQTMMYLMLSVAGHLTIFQTRTRGPWWSIRPAWILFAAVCGTQAVATLVAVYGAWLVTPLGWEYAGIVWGYALAWFLVTDPLKLLAYKVLDTAKSEAKPEAKAAPKPDAKSEIQAEAKPKTEDEPKPDTKPEPTPGAKSAPQFGAKIEAKPEVELKPDAKADLATLLNTSLGDLLVAGLVKDPEDAGRIIAAAVSQAKASITAPKAPETDAASKAKPQGKAEPAVKSEAQPDGKSKTPADVMP
jgi:H+-transporting ATPase